LPGRKLGNEISAQVTIIQIKKSKGGFKMRNKYMLVGVVVGIVVGVLLSSAVFVLAGNTDSPSAPGATNSFTLEDIYNRLDTGAAGAQSTFTEPGVAPGTGTMHTLNETMAKAPARDDANGATTGDVANGKTFWGLNVAGGEWGLQTGIGCAGVPKTGQTKCYTDTVNSEVNCPAAGWPGQDGDLQKGVAWPNPRFTDNGDGTVTDNLTELIWLKDANCILTQYSGYDADGKVTWQQALQFVAGINDGTYPNCGAGHTDWRLPNVREMQSLVHYGFYDPAVPDTAGTGQWTAGDPFDNVQSVNYWSSTTHPFTTGRAWIVMLRGGHVSHDLKTSTYYVWPVRGGQ
jgi:hypothetical protein